MPVGQSTHGFADGPAGLEVQSAMKMVGTYLTEVTGEDDRKIKRGSKRRRLHLRHSFHIGRLLCISALYAANEK